MNEEAREARPTPSDCLIARTKDFILLPIRDKKSVMVSPTVFNKLWFCAEEGIPTKLKNTRRLDYEGAHEKLRSLVKVERSNQQRNVLGGLDQVRFTLFHFI